MIRFLSGTLLITMITIYSCMKENTSDCNLGDIVGFSGVELDNSGTFEEVSFSGFLPINFQHEALQGIDTFVGQIGTEEEPNIITYDIGYLAGYYVDPTDSEAEESNAVNVNYFHKTTESQIRATFPTMSANFICQDLDEAENFFCFLNSIEVE